MSWSPSRSRDLNLAELPQSSFERFLVLRVPTGKLVGAHTLAAIATLHKLRDQSFDRRFHHAGLSAIKLDKRAMAQE